MSRSRHRSETPNIYMFVFAEERERSDSSIHLAHGSSRSSCHTRSDQAAAHVPLPRITMSKSCFFGANFHSAREATPPARQARRAAWARCIGGLFRPVKRKKQNNFSACGWSEKPSNGRISEHARGRCEPLSHVVTIAAHTRFPGGESRVPATMRRW